MTLYRSIQYPTFSSLQFSPPFQRTVIAHTLFFYVASQFQRESKQHCICVKAIHSHLNHKLLGFVLCYYLLLSGV